MENHIKKLHEATENIEIFIASAYDWIDGKSIPSLGIRDKENKGINIDNTFWLIAGTPYSNKDHKHIQYLSQFVANIENVYIDLRAQAMVYGHMITVELGKRKIVKYELAEDRVFAVIEVL